MMMMRMRSAKVAILIVVVTIGSQFASAHYNKEQFKEIALNDDTNDDAINLSAQQLLKRSGFNYEEYYSIADDGYVTQLIRVVNPLADRSKLKQPPVMMHHGASVDNSVYLISSSIQHYPEKWPRELNSPMPITSSNRSLAFTLANNGYDVWLIGTRGSNKDNQAYEENVLEARQDPQWRPRDENYEFIKKNKKKYWQYGLDDIIDFELKHQIDKVKQVTGSLEVSIFCFSLSTPTTMAFLARKQEYAKNVRVYIQMAPAIAADHFTTFDTIYFEKICPRLPTRGIGFVPLYSFTPLVRKLIVKLSLSRRVRYTLIQKFLTALFGPSLKYTSNLELNLLAHTWKSVSFKSIQHYCQNSLNKRLTRFNYGKKSNVDRYNQKTPPEYNIGKLDVQNWVVVSGSGDGLADPNTVQRLLETTNTPKPPQHIQIAGYNHLDFLGGIENARYVNLPVLAALDAHSIVPKS